MHLDPELEAQMTFYEARHRGFHARHWSDETTEQSIVIATWILSRRVLTVSRVVTNLDTSGT